MAVCVESFGGKYYVSFSWEFVQIFQKCENLLRFDKVTDLSDRPVLAQLVDVIV